MGREESGVPVEQISTGLADPPVSGVREESGIGGVGEEAAATGHVVSDAAPASLVRRSFDASEINAILNDPYVFKHVAIPGQERLDVSALVDDPRVYLLMAERGGLIFVPVEPCVYEVHTSFLKPDHGSLAYGRQIRNIGLASYRWMFTQTDCVVLLTKVPAHNVNADKLAPMLGWTKEFSRKNAFTTFSGDLVDVNYYALRYDDWVRETRALELSGRSFHQKLEDEFARFGKVEPQHPDEDCHDRHVGACAEMMLGGQVEKAMILYNRWARFAGYGEIRVVSNNPPLVDIGNALLQIIDGDFKVLRCR